MLIIIKIFMLSNLINISDIINKIEEFQRIENIND